MEQARKMGKVTDSRNYKSETFYRVENRAFTSGYAWVWNNQVGSLKELKQMVNNSKEV